MKHILQYLAALVLVLSSAAAFVACGDDDSTGGAPEITGVRITDPAKADSLFATSAPDSLIVIIGRNLGGAQRVFINDQQVWFNSVFNTDHSIIVKIPSEDDGFQLTAFNSELKDEIRVETSHGTATYAFKIKAPRPSISRLQARYPRQAGDVLNIYGLNLVDIRQVYFTSLEAAELDSTRWTEIGGTHVAAPDLQTLVKDHHNVSGTTTYETTSHLTVSIPVLPFERGSLVVECDGGTVYFPFSLTLSAPTISTARTDGGLSTEMPVPGETVSVYGTEFVQVEAVTYGDVTLAEDEYEVAETEDRIDFVFARKPSQGSAATLTIVTGGGQVSVPFYDTSALLVDFDGRGTNNGWGPDASYETTDGSAAPFTADGTFARFNIPAEGTQWWGTMVYFRKDWEGKFDLPSFDAIPATASTDNVFLAMEVYNNGSDYNDGSFPGYLRYFIQNDSEDPVAQFDDSGNPNPVETVNQYDNGFTWDVYDETFTFDRPVLADIQGQTPTGTWYRHVVPLSAFLKYRGKTYGDVVGQGINQLRIQSINQGSARGKIDVCIDNIRLYYHK